MSYKSDREIYDIVASFEDASIAREKWTHAEHLVVALYYLRHHNFEAAYGKMKSGIMNLLVSGFKLDLAKEMPYHETLTMFWMKTVDDHIRGEASPLEIHKIATELVSNYDKNHPLKFYTRERLFSDEARSAYIEPDK